MKSIGIEEPLRLPARWQRLAAAGKCVNREYVNWKGSHTDTGAGRQKIQNAVKLVLGVVQPSGTATTNRNIELDAGLGRRGCH